MEGAAVHPLKSTKIEGRCECSEVNIFARAALIKCCYLLTPCFSIKQHFLSLSAWCQATTEKKQPLGCLCKLPAYAHTARLASVFHAGKTQRTQCFSLHISSALSVLLVSLAHFTMCIDKCAAFNTACAEI